MGRAHTRPSTTAGLLAATGLLTLDRRATLRRFNTRRDPGFASTNPGCSHRICSDESGERGGGATPLRDHSSHANEPNVAMREAGEINRMVPSSIQTTDMQNTPLPRSHHPASTVPALLAVLGRERVATMVGLSATPVWPLWAVRPQTTVSCTPRFRLPFQRAVAVAADSAGVPLLVS